MTETRYWTQLAMEQFPPSDVVRQAQGAERAGFDAVNVSDHFQPWWEPGESGHAWVTLGAIGQATEAIPIGTGVTAPVFRHNPAVTAQAFMTLEELNAGRAFLGVGSGEALNEVPCGMDWPAVDRQVDRLDEALQIIGRLFDGERVDFDGRFFRIHGAYLHTRAERRPKIYVSAFGERAAGVAARHGDGVWTLADPDMAPAIIAAYRAACDDIGKEAGEIVLQTGFSYAEDDAAALEGARAWKGAQPKEFYTDDWHDPKAMYEKGERDITDEEFREMYILSADPAYHADRVREVERLGATVVCLQNASGIDPHRAFEVYGREVLPALRGARVG